MRGLPRLLALLSLGCTQSHPTTTNQPADQPDAGMSPPDAGIAGNKLLPFGALPRSNVRLPHTATPCTSDAQAAAAGTDRWCAVDGPGIWVVNVSALGRGESFACDGKDPRCLRLATAGESDGFFDDTLLYANGGKRDASYQLVGPRFAWRPGWSAPRAVSGAGATSCEGRGKGVLCHENAAVDPSARTYSAGLVADESGPRLPMVPALTGTILGQVTPDGAHVTADTRSPLQVASSLPFELRIIALADGQSRSLASVLSYVASTEHIYYVTGPAGPQFRATGTLHAARFSAAMPEQTIASGVTRALPVPKSDGSERGLLVWRNPDERAAGTLEYYEATAPDQLSLVRQLSGVRDPSEDDLSVELGLMAIQQPAEDVLHGPRLLVGSDLSGVPCAFSDPRRPFSGTWFAPAPGLLFWTENGSAGVDLSMWEYFVAPISDCTAKRSLGNLDQLVVGGADGIVTYASNRLSFTPFDGKGLGTARRLVADVFDDRDFFYEPTAKVLLYNSGGGGGIRYLRQADF